MIEVVSPISSRSVQVVIGTSMWRWPLINKVSGSVSILYQ